MNNKPLISVIMPIYNAEKRIREAINSILFQTYNKIELILVNDGSSDNSAVICNNYAHSDKRVKVIHQENKGVSAARNTGLINATGDFIMFIDSDDTLEFNAFESIIPHIYESTDMVMFGISFDYYLGDKMVDIKRMSYDKNLTLNKSSLKNYFFQLYDLNYLSSSWNKIIRTEIIKDNLLKFEIDMAILEDFKFVLDVLEKCNKIIVLEGVYYRYYNDLASYPFGRRPNIDYLNNFKLLEKKLRNFSNEIKLLDTNSINRINSMIFRFYLIGIEKSIASKKIWKNQYDFIKNYIEDRNVESSIKVAKPNGKKLKILHLLMEKKLILLLWLLIKLKLTSEMFKRNIVRKTLSLK